MWLSAGGYLDHCPVTLARARRVRSYSLAGGLDVLFRCKVITWTLPADRSLTINMKRVRDEVPEGAGVLTAEYWRALADRNQGLDAFDYVVLTGNGSGQPGRPLPPSVPLGDSPWQNTEDHLQLKPPSVFGFRLSHSAYGFGPYVLKKSN